MFRIARDRLKTGCILVQCRLLYLIEKWKADSCLGTFSQSGCRWSS